MSTPARFSDGQHKNWLKCSQSLIIMKEALHDYIDNEVKKLHDDIKQKVSSILCGSSAGNQCGSCSWKDIRLKRGIYSIWHIICKNNICDKWLHAILAVHDDPCNRSINWKNADISKWPTDCYQVAKIFMPKGQDKTTYMPNDLDALAVLSLMKHCSWFRKDLPNVHILSDLMDIQNKVRHSDHLRVADSDKHSWIDQMILLLSYLNIHGDAQAELQMLKNSPVEEEQRVTAVEEQMKNDEELSLQRGTPLLCKEMKSMTNGQELLGRGAFGEVYRRQDDESNTTMAVKIIKHGGMMSEEKALRSIKNEIKILAKLDHHRLVKFHGCLQKETCIEIFLEYMPNGSVKDYMFNHDKPFSEPMTAKITKDILEGIIYLHERKILHRDVKGSNVLLDNEMNAKLGDFGISKEVETLTNSNTGCNTHVGSPYWMSPERIKGEKYGKKADIWSIGCTVVEMLTMHPPWHNFETSAAIFKIGNGSDPIYHLPPAASAKLKDFLSQTFRQKSEERPKATELLNHSFFLLDSISLR